MLLLADGFDHYGSAPLTDFYESAAGAVVSAAAARSGPMGVRISVGTNDSGLRVPFGSSPGTVNVALALRANQLPRDAISAGIVQFEANYITGGAPRALSTLLLMPTGALMMRGWDRSGPVVAVSAPCVAASAYHHIEVDAAFTGENNSMVVRVDGVEVLSAIFSYPEDEKPGNETNPYGQAPSRAFIGGCRGAPKTGSGGVLFDIDDVAAGSGGFFGDQKNVTRLPDSDGPEQEWEPASGSSGFAMVDAVPPLDSAEYLLAEEAARSSFGLEAFPAGTVTGLQVTPRLWKSGGETGISAGMASGGDEETKPVSLFGDVGTAPKWYAVTIDTDPATGLPWLVTDLNNALVILDRTA